MRSSNRAGGLAFPRLKLPYGPLPSAPWGSSGDRTRSLAWTLALVVAYTAAEVIGGLWSGSLALLADAGHMVSDAAALALTLFAIRFARRAPTSERTFGFHRAEILAALVNGVTLIGSPSLSFWKRTSGCSSRSRSKVA